MFKFPVGYDFTLAICGITSLAQRGNPRITTFSVLREKIGTQLPCILGNFACIKTPIQHTYATLVAFLLKRRLFLPRDRRVLM